MEPVALSETLSRFILKEKYIRANNTVRHAALMPNKNDEVSVFRISGITDNEVWDIGDREVATKQGKPIFGRADIIASIVISKELKIIPTEPPEKHADITGWPVGRSEQKQIALELAAELVFHKK
ncbi:MAG: hypothetical protein K8F52_02660 [Candidatus Scalindua rubra]|uniref:Uncharacterized protein n=1 Tax=Candidatus Scalindua brodae TaxID=237368 RepID=A0A0B0EEQ7_9BACT|nr:MAG: hypothetical protein SCABRO_03673 [Candidatus Scalindua brodae]MBZ0107547.1 hypothetical protein [Candidatus Scalindua rubra]TWU34755.1 hypothetical protein S225a_11130 [Candidatus Brocadiaceae bacterium S225]